MKKVLLAVFSVLAIATTAFAKDSSVKAIAVYGDTMAQVEAKVATEIAKMNKGNYKHGGISCDVASAYNVEFKGGGSSYGVGADGSLTASRPMAWIKFRCTNYSSND